MIDIQVLTVRPHPNQATSHPGYWAVQLCVRHAGHTRTFWRWFARHTLGPNGNYIPPSNEPSPKHAEIIERFWDDTFSELHGFDFRND